MSSNPFRQARFLTSANRPDQLPADAGAEVAFAGRSNAGKSSALNVICEQHGLARTSKTPGRTQLLNVFPVGDDAHRLAPRDQSLHHLAADGAGRRCDHDYGQILHD